MSFPPITATQEQCNLVADVVESWVENLYEGWRNGISDAPDDEEMFEDHGPGAVYILRNGQPLMMDIGNWRAVEYAVYGIVMGDDDGIGYAEAFEVSIETLQAACAALGLTVDYFEGGGPRRGDQ